MNEMQRQLLADAIDSISFEIQRAEEGINEKQASLDRQKDRLSRLKAQKAELEEGIDWE